MRYRLEFTPPSVLETYLGTRAVAKTFRASGAAGELARLGVDLHLLAFLDEERHANLKAGLERGCLGHAARGGVTANARLGLGHRQLHVRRELDGDRVAVVLEDLHEEVVDEQLAIVADRVGRST